MEGEEHGKFEQEAVAGKSTGETGKAAETEAGRPQNGLSLLHVSRADKNNGRKMTMPTITTATTTTTRVTGTTTSRIVERRARPSSPPHHQPRVGS